ncbi:probable WRKY transcription factor 33 [Rhodamnia argentea]|uniref:Probable WRKY transcription factor 33 n=1 Tax=Rhodamnia argentea TaxID=178133 RepID=A0A8B8NPD8_9MYRT|nr:probable WRKY transcription factor 33 [Rhodamnia argentea]
MWKKTHERVSACVRARCFHGVFHILAMYFLRTPKPEKPSQGKLSRSKSAKKDMDREAGNRLELPQDGYEWRKYGQKFIKNIGKFRSYFKCQRAGCDAKKRAEWSETEPGDLRVVYEGVHNHGSSSQDQSGSSQSGASSTRSNQYNLLNQMFGDNPPSDSKRSND